MESASDFRKKEGQGGGVGREKTSEDRATENGRVVRSSSKR